MAKIVSNFLLKSDYEMIIFDARTSFDLIAQAYKLGTGRLSDFLLYVQRSAVDKKRNYVPTKTTKLVD